MATGSEVSIRRAASFRSFEQSVASLRDRLERDSTALALIVLRSPDIERVAWRDGRPAARALERSIARAFLSAAQRLTRAQDVVAHDPGSDCFSVAMLSSARGSRVQVDARAAQERIAAAVWSSRGHRLEGGWTPIEAAVDVADPQSVMARALERGSRERERYEFLAAVGHELRTPLTSIRGYIETVLDESEHDPAIDPRSTRAFLGSALREAQRMSRLVDGMLEFSLLDLSSRGSPEQTCDAGERVRAALTAIRPLAVDRRVRISTTLARAGRVFIGADSLAHVLVNLLENAVKYGRGPGRVRVGCAPSGAYLCVAIDDDGPGIEESERESIFGMGVRGASAVGNGSGIGLAIVRSIVDRAGGHISVGRSPLGGARFAVHLRMAHRQQSDGAFATATDPQTKGRRPNSRPS